MKRIELEELLSKHQNDPYPQQYVYICDLIRQGKIKPVQKSALNGKKPALHQSYWLLEEKEDFSAYEDEIRFALAPGITTDYYLRHPEIYREERKWVLQLNRFLKEEGRDRQTLEPASLNERSFEIWGREKFLQKEQGKRVLKHCGIGLRDLEIYQTTEPLAYYSRIRCVPQNILILENKDTFYSMRKHLLSGESQIFGREIGTLIYGAGKGILRSFEDFRFCVEPYMNAEENRLLYFGDLDYEGIGIFEKLAELFAQEVPILPFVEAYQYMLKKYGTGELDFLPESSEKQNRNIEGSFFSFFPDKAVRQMKQILEQGKYIPQECLNRNDFTRGQYDSFK